MRNTLISILVCCLATPIPGVALAQDGDDDAEVVLDEIIVLTTRREESVMDVPFSIQAIPETVLELPTFNDMADVVNLVPGATGYGQKPPFHLGVQFRGSGIIQNISGGLSPVGYYVDDIPYVDISTPTPPPMSTFDLQQVEIVRGPQGTSWGQDSSAGSVIMRTNPVDLQNFGYKTRVAVSDVMHYSGTGFTVGGVLNMPIAEDVFGIRLSYLREDDPGHGTVVGRPDIENPLESSRDTIRLKAFWQASDKIDVEFTYSLWDTEYGITPSTQIVDSTGGWLRMNTFATPIMTTKFPDGIVKNSYEITWTTLRASFDLGFAELTSSTGFVDTPKKETNNEDVFDLGFGPLGFGVIFNQPAESLTQEFRLLSTTESRLQWITGVFFLDAESASEGFTDFPLIQQRVSRGSIVKTDALAVFGEIEYEINDQWSVLFGLRYHDEERTDDAYRFEAADYVNDPVFGPFTNEIDFPPTSNAYDHLSHRLGLTWMPNEDGMVYLTHSTANRAPLILQPDDELALEMAGIPPFGDRDAAELVNTELGTKWTLLDDRLQLEAAYVHGEWKDIPLWSRIQVPAAPPFTMAIGGTDAVVETWELAFNWALTDQFGLTYAGAFTDTEVQKIPTAPEVVGYIPAVVVGGDLYNYSPATHNIGINYDQELGGDWELFVSANYVTRDKPDGVNAFDLTATEFVPAAEKFENLSINIGARRGAWDVAFSVDNVTDFDGMYFPGTSIETAGLIPYPTTYSIQVSYDGMP